MESGSNRTTPPSDTSPTDVRIVDYTEDLKDSVLSLLSKGRASRFGEWKRAIWDWQYADNPNYVKPFSPTVVIEAGNVIGFYGTIPVALKYRDKQIMAMWGCDFFVDPQQRGKGHAQRMLRALRRKSPIILGLGISAAALPILKKHGRKISTEIESFVYQNRPGSLRDSIKRGIHHYKRFKNRAHHPSVDGLETQIIDAMDAPEEIDTVWAKSEKGYPKVIIRNHAFIQWRYGKYPMEKYQLILVTREGGIAGVGVFRKHPEESRLVDYVGPAKSIQTKYLIVNTFMRECTESISLNCICTDGEIKTCLEYHGFIKSRHKPTFSVLSTIPGDVDPEKDWFVMGGDSDIDLIAATADDIYDS